MPLGYQGENLVSATNFIAWSEKPKWPEVLKPKKNLRTWGSKAES